MPNIAFDNHHPGRTYARLKNGERVIYLGLLPDSPTPLLDLVLSHAKSLPSSQIDVIQDLKSADKSLRDPGRKTGRPKKQRLTKGR